LLSLEGFLKVAIDGSEDVIVKGSGNLKGVDFTDAVFTYDFNLLEILLPIINSKYRIIAFHVSVYILNK